MRALGISVIAISIAFATFATTESARAGAACGPLSVIASLDLVRLPSGRPAIEALIGDKPHTLLIDTGGFLSMLSSQAVSELGLTPTQARTGVVDVTGQIADQAVRLPSITIGRLRQEGPYFWVDPTSSPEFAGLIGPDMLQNFDADFDFEARKLNLISPDHCAGNVVYWQAPAVAIVPMTLDRAGHISFRMELDGKRVNAMLDTGASNTVLNLDIARRTFRVDVNAPDVERVGEITGGYTSSVYRRRFKTLAVDGVTINNPTLVMYPDMMGGGDLGRARTGSIIREERRGLPDLILGMNVLSQMHVYIAYRERKLYITSANPQPDAAPPPR